MARSIFRWSEGRKGNLTDAVVCSQDVCDDLTGFTAADRSLSICEMPCGLSSGDSKFILQGFRKRTALVLPDFKSDWWEKIGNVSLESRSQILEKLRIQDSVSLQIENKTRKN